MHLKVQTHNLVARTHTVKAGTFPVQIYREHPHGLYAERDFYGHPRYRHWQAHILPELHLQVCRFSAHADDHPLEYYIDIVSVEREGHLWRVKDLYLDLGIGHDGRLSLMDTAELFEATRLGLITLGEAFLTTNTLHELVNLLGLHANDLGRALGSRGVALEWGPEALVAS